MLADANLGHGDIERWLDITPLKREVVESLRSTGVRTYLVGGTVRDALLGRESYDLDFTIEGNSLALARTLANRLGGSVFCLDPERDVARVVYKADRFRLYVDLAALRARDIVEDLNHRDFTINAMAWPLSEGRGELIDPTGGQRDLRAGVLRATSEISFIEDPLRLLRAVRLRGALGFEVEPYTEDLVRRDARALARASMERVRDEVFQILGLSRAASHLEYAHSLGLLEIVVPELGSRIAEALETVGRLEALYGPLLVGEAGRVASLGEEVRPYAEAIARRWGEEISMGRALSSLVRLAALSAQASDAVALARRFRLSRREAQHLGMTVSAGRYVLAQSEGLLVSRVEVYRYYRRFGEAGVDGALLAPSLGPAKADLWSAVGVVLRAWFCQRDQMVDPPRLVTGDDISAALGGAGGPLIGEMLEALREAQVEGKVRTRGEALEFVRNRGVG